jgi:hypothetical protein
MRPDGLASGFLAGQADLADDGRWAGLPESQIPRAGATAASADAAHLRR